MTTKVFELRIKAGEMLGLIESLGLEYKEECIEILQSLANAVFSRMSSGKVQSVEFIACHDNKKTTDFETKPSDTDAINSIIAENTHCELDEHSDGGGAPADDTDPDYHPRVSPRKGVKRRCRSRLTATKEVKKPKTEVESDNVESEQSSAGSESENEILEDESQDVANDSDNNFEDTPDDMVYTSQEEAEQAASLDITTKRSFDCDFCEGQFSTDTEAHLLDHIRENHLQKMLAPEHSDSTGLNCTSCEKQFLHRKSLRTTWVSLLWHRQVKHGKSLPWYVTVISCPHCRKFKCCSNHALAQHMKVVHQSKTKKGKVLCTNCNILVKPCEFKSHMRACEEGESRENDDNQGKGFWCGLCKVGNEEKQTFKGETMAELVKHVKEEHVQWKSGRKNMRKGNLKCDRCPKSIVCRTNIKELYFLIMWHRSERHDCNLPDYIKVLTCPQCETYSCVSKKDLRDHVRSVHSNTRRINCVICNASIKPCSLKAHMKSSHSEETKPKLEIDGGIYACQFCARAGKEFSAGTYLDLINHAKTEHMKFKMNQSNCRAAYLSCDICDKSLVCRSTLKNLHDNILWHRSERHGVPLPSYVQVMQCQQCHNYSCVSMKDMRNHIRQVHKMQRAPCELCGTMIKPSSMHTHLKSRHPSDRQTINCSLCDKTYTGKANLQKHIERMHTGVKSFLCDICCKQFFEHDEMYKHMYNRHKANPLNKKTYQCNDCDYQALSLKDVASHATVHSEKRNWCCELCGKEFKRRGSLNTHRIIMHSDGIPKFSCNECGFSTHVKQYLIRHKVIHSEQKKHVCQICGYATHFQENLRKHEKNKHGQSFGKRQRYKMGTAKGNVHILPRSASDSQLVPTPKKEDLLASVSQLPAYGSHSAHTIQSQSEPYSYGNHVAGETTMTNASAIPTYYQYAMPAMVPVFPSAVASTSVVTSTNQQRPTEPATPAGIQYSEAAAIEYMNQHFYIAHT